MEKNEIFSYEDLKLYEAPPVAFVNLKEKNNNKIVKDNSFIILSSYSKNKAKNEYSELKIDINIETLRYQSKQILLDMMTFIQHFCHVSLVSPNYILNNNHLEIKKSGIKENQYSLSLKNINIVFLTEISYMIKIIIRILTLFIMENLNVKNVDFYLKTKMNWKIIHYINVI